MRYSIDNPIAISHVLLSNKVNTLFKNPINKVLFINPLFFPEDQFNLTVARNKRYYCYPPYGIGLLSANLNKIGINTAILDLNMEVLASVENSNSDYFSTKDISNLWVNKLNDTLKSFRPDLIGISCTFTMSHNMLMSIAKHSKSILSSPIIAGGVHATNSAEIILRECSDIDFIISHEADLAFPALLNFINIKQERHSLKHIGSMIDGNYIKIDDFQFPDQDIIDQHPDYSNLPIGEYSSLGEVGTFRFWQKPNTKSSTILTNRGCRGRCSFCTVHKFYRKKVRARNIESVITEIEQLKIKYGINHITFLDDDLFLNAKRAYSLFGQFITKGLDITWDATNGIIASAVAKNPELIEIAANSGCIGMYFGIESGNPEILRSVHKPSTVDDCLAVGSILNKYSQIFTRGFLIIGFPGETVKQINDTINLAINMALDWYTVSMLTPLPATEIYEDIIMSDKQKIANNESISHLTGLVGYGYNVRHAESRRIIEQQGKTSTTEFNFFNNLDLVPTKEELNDLWLVADYKINYEPILYLEDKCKLVKLNSILNDISNRMTSANPLSNLFLGITELKLGNVAEKNRRFMLSKGYLENSSYWQKFFNALELNKYYAL